MPVAPESFMIRQMVVVAVFLSSVGVASSRAYAQNKTTAGDFSVEPPTLVSLGFDWKIAGDDNRNAEVETSYRKKGESAWRKGLPLMRLQREGERRPAPATDNRDARYPPFDYTAANMFAGSILNLDPDTEYECRFVLSDPDGVSGRGGEDRRPCARARSRSRRRAGTRITSIPSTGKDRSRSPPSPA